MGKEMFREKENIFSDITEGEKRTNVRMERKKLPDMTGDEL